MFLLCLIRACAGKYRGVLKDSPLDRRRAVFRFAVSNASDGQSGWITNLKALHTSPQTAVTKSQMDFVELIEWCKSFHILDFLDPIADSAIIDNLVTRLRNSKTDVNSSKLTTERFVKCTCSRYMNYAWCLHACVWAFHKEIIRGVPFGCKQRSADLIGKVSAGRHENAKRGGALGTK